MFFIAFFYLLGGQQCDDSKAVCKGIKNQKACEFMWGNNNVSCLWKLGPSPACVPDYNQCEILGEYCHLDPGCFVNADGKCVEDPCVESDYNDDHSFTCSNKYCVAHLMYDYDDATDTFYNWTMCTSPTNNPNACYYLAHYSGDGAYVYNSSVCTHQSSCQNVQYNTPAFSGYYCSDGREEILSKSKASSENSISETDRTIIYGLLIAILVIVAIGFCVLGIVFIIVAASCCITPKKQELESGGKMQEETHSTTDQFSSNNDTDSNTNGDSVSTCGQGGSEDAGNKGYRPTKGSYEPGLNTGGSDISPPIGMNVGTGTDTGVSGSGRSPARTRKSTTKIAVAEAEYTGTQRVKKASSTRSKGKKQKGKSMSAVTDSS